LKKLLATIVIVFLYCGFVFAEGQQEESLGQIEVTLWTKANEGDGSLQYVKDLAHEYHKQNQQVTIRVVNKSVEALREDFQTESAADKGPDFLWTVNDHVRPFAEADIIQPIGDQINLDKFLESAVNGVKYDGEVWGVPISSGNHITLLYNKSIITEPPETTKQLIEKSKELTTGKQYGLVFSLDEPYFLAPWLYGFDGSFFEYDGHTPSLNSPAMVNALQFFKDLKDKHKVLPENCNYERADMYFMEGKAAMTINGAWKIDMYKKVLGEDLGIARIPKISETQKWPQPLISGISFMIAADAKGTKRDVIMDFITYATNQQNQIQQVKRLNRLPALKAALNDTVIQSNEILYGLAEQVKVGTAMPIVLEMRCNWEAMRPELKAVLENKKTPQEAAKAMQKSAESCVANQK